MNQKNRAATGRVAKVMMYLTWIVGLALASYFFQIWIEHKHNPNQFISSNPDTPLVLQQNAQGHYVASGEINNVAVTFLLDTGATHVIISEDPASKLRLVAQGTTRVITANGVISVYPTYLKSIKIGTLEASGVKALINPFAVDSTVLLGMSFLKHLTLIQRDGTLTLSAP